MSGSLAPSDFVEYFAAVHGQQPFPWQRELAEVVVSSGWPSLLDIPTGLGKTATLDVAVFALACQADSGRARSAPLRTFFVVDRRIVVDEAYERALKIATALEDAEDGMLLRVATALRRFTNDVGDGPPEMARPPLAIARLRGGVPRDTDWAETPSQPLIVLSTVDQVGSRLLFRGYGVTRRSAPIHAGLVGADALWLLDEVHLSQPFEQTLRAVEKSDASDAFSAVPRTSPFVVSRLSATPGLPDEHRFDFFSPVRLAENLANDETSLRLNASKPATVERYRSDSPSSVKAATRTLISADKAPMRIGVIVNTIATARAVFDDLQATSGTEADVHLLIGRVRDLDRERIVRNLEGFKANLQRAAVGRHQVLVATQTVEAGADFDFDALVTEIAPLDALRQRFGRLNRLGRSTYSKAVILVPDRTLKDVWKTIDRIYGESAEKTAEWLQMAVVKNMIDFGSSAMHKRLQKVDDISILIAPRLNAPVLLPSHVRDLAMTAAVPSNATPDVELYLHGRRLVNDVGIVWRADIVYKTPRNTGVVDDAILTSLNACPISAPEVLDLPIYHAQRLIGSQLSSSDVDGDDQAMQDVPIEELEAVRQAGGRGSDQKYCLIQRAASSESPKWISVDELRVGDTVIVPCGFGGYDEHGWCQASTGWVRDLGLQANEAQRRRIALRFTPQTVRDVLEWELKSGATQSAVDTEVRTSSALLWKRMCDAVSADITASHAVRALTDVVPATWREPLERLAEAPGTIFRAVNQRDDLEQGFVLYQSRNKVSNTPKSIIPSGQPSTTSDDGSSNTGALVRLADHSANVRKRAERYARESSLSDRTAALVGIAAYLHDVGKADERFQADLRNEASLYVLGLTDAHSEQLYAKSAHGYVPNAPRATPKNFRHEALSVALAVKHPLVASLPDDERDIVLWLIGTHHGFGRPFFPISDGLFEGPRIFCDALDGPALEAETSEMPIRVDSDWFALVERVIRRHGPWELARLEGVLRLADHRQSAYEQTMQDRQGKEIRAL